MSVGQVKAQLQSIFQASFLVNESSIEEVEDGEKTKLIIRLRCVSVVEESSELTKLLRAAKAKIPKSYSAKIKLEFNL